MSKHKKDKRALIEAITTMLKGNQVVQEAFDQFGVDVDSIDSMPIDFADLKVSAKTKNGKVYLNNRLLDDEDFAEDIHYIVHEAIHWLQQTNGDADKYRNRDDLEYLDLPAEIEAFQFQVKYMDQMEGRKQADDYLEHLLDFHDFEGEDRDEKKKQLMEKLD